MNLRSIKIENFTVFDAVTINFCEGINVFIGENATGKTHLLKLLYSACRSNRVDTDFGQKIVRTLMPDDFRIARLVDRRQGNHIAKVKVCASNGEEKTEVQLGITFDKKSTAEVKGKERWEKVFKDNSSIFIPAKEILSHSYKLAAATSVDNVRFDDTYIDIINSAKIDITMGKNPVSRAAMLKRIEKMTNGQVIYDAEKDEFYLKKGNSKQEFNLVAEGAKKMGLLWLLAKNGTFLQQFRPDDLTVTLEREKDNQHDGNAIQIVVHIKPIRRRTVIGYVPKGLAGELSKVIDMGIQVDIYTHLDFTQIQEKMEMVDERIKIG